MDVTEAVDHQPQRRGVVLGAAIAVAVVIAALIAVLATRDPATDRTNDSPLIGHIAPAVVGDTIATTDDAPPHFDLDLQRGQWVVVNFFATWCVPCIREHPELIEFEERHAEAGDASVVSVVFDDEASDVVDFFREHGGDWPVVDGEAVILDWAVAAVPESFIVDPDGRVAARVTGGVSADGLDALIERLQGA
jgi:cytochrome c biogenesis protein CcmG/thiol:disulfide interchange protein DsbE